MVKAHTNIFRTQYQQPENKLTYAFLCLLEHLTPTVRQSIISAIGVCIDPIANLQISGLCGGGESNPDGCLTLILENGRQFQVYLEVKTARRGLDLDQLRKHLNCLRSPLEKLFVITADRNDSSLIAELDKKEKIVFTTWHDLIGILHRLCKVSDASTTDAFLLDQFIEYTETSNEAWRARMVEPQILEAYSRSLELKDQVREFLRQGWQLMDAVKSVLVGQFSPYIRSFEVASHWGRLGVECHLDEALWEQWVFFGIYFDPYDHGIPFKIPCQPEFSVFLDMDPKYWPQFQKVAGAMQSMHALMTHGFEFNCPNRNLRNPWRVAYWRDPMSNHFHRDLQDICKVFALPLQALFQSEFYSKFRQVERRS